MDDNSDETHNFKIMTIYSFWIFDRHCNCIFDREWTQVDQTSGSTNSKNNEDSAKLLFGALFSLRNIAKKLGDTENTSNDLNSFSTAKYRAHYFESASGLRFCILSDPTTQHLQNVLRDIYENIYVELIVKNALSPVDFKPDTKITNQTFIKHIDKYIISLN